jgi:predicted nucleic acid-binding protein
MIILDTSVWIEYFKKREPHSSEVKTLLNSRMIVAFEPVFGELLQGAKSKKEKDIILGYWKYSPKLLLDQLFIRSGEYSFENNLINKGVGLIDASIIIAAKEKGFKIYTLDKKILKTLDQQYIYK